MSSMNKNRYIYADIGLLHSKKARLIAAISGIVIVIILVIVFAPGWNKHDLAREYIDTLYTTTPEDLTDPAVRVEKLRALAADEVVDHLLETDCIPAVELHENGINAETYFEYTSLTQDQQTSDERWNHAIAGNIHVINHDLNTNRTTWRGAICFRIEKVEGEWRIVDVTGVNWQGK